MGITSLPPVRGHAPPTARDGQTPRIPDRVTADGVLLVGIDGTPTDVDGGLRSVSNGRRFDRTSTGQSGSVSVITARNERKWEFDRVEEFLDPTDTGISAPVPDLRGVRTAEAFA